MVVELRWRIWGLPPELSQCRPIIHPFTQIIPYITRADPTSGLSHSEGADSGGPLFELALHQQRLESKRIDGRHIPCSERRLPELVPDNLMFELSNAGGLTAVR